MASDATSNASSPNRSASKPSSPKALFAPRVIVRLRLWIGCVCRDRRRLAGTREEPAGCGRACARSAAIRLKSGCKRCGASTREAPRARSMLTLLPIRGPWAGSAGVGVEVERSGMSQGASVASRQWQDGCHTVKSSLAHPCNPLNLRHFGPICNLQSAICNSRRTSANPLPSCRLAAWICTETMVEVDFPCGLSRWRLSGQSVGRSS